MTIRPLNGYLLVQKDKAKDTTKGGLHLPQSVQKDQIAGKVIAASENWRDAQGNLREMDIGVGDRIVFNKFGAKTITIEGDEYTFLSKDDVFCVVED